jgi:heterodisulfide reductase subunit A
MYSLKLAHLVKEKLPDAEVHEYYIDMRAFGKGYEEFYERIKNEGINIIRGRTAKIEQKKNGKLLMRSEDIQDARLIEKEVDMAILAVGLEPSGGNATLAKTLGIALSDEGWFMEANPVADSTNTFTGGISIAGVCQGPKDIPDTVAQASAAASRVLQSIITGKIKKNINELTVEQIKEKANELSTI